jgi:hypothetical protein
VHQLRVYLDINTTTSPAKRVRSSASSGHNAPMAAVQTNGTDFPKRSFMGAAAIGWLGWKADWRHRMCSAEWPTLTYR